MNHTDGRRANAAFMHGARRGSILALALTVLVVMLALVSIGAAQVSASRRILDRTALRRAAESLAASAFEEAALELQQALGPIDPPQEGQARDLAMASWPQEVAPDATRAELPDVGGSVSAVRVRTSPWVLQVGRDAQGRLISRESGVVEMDVTVAVKSAAGALARTFRVRRYAAVVPENGELRVKVLAGNLYSGVEE